MPAPMEIATGNGDLQCVVLRADAQSEVTIYAFGAHITSWKDAAGRERIYTSPTALYNGVKAIRGGIPICFPQFGKHGQLKQHGFARNSVWEIDQAYRGSVPSAARFVLRDTESSRASAWPHRFELSFIVTLSPCGNELTCDMSVKNCQDTPFSFTCALHSYFTCDAQSTQLPDFDNLSYTDSIDGNKEKSQVGVITFGKEVDRVYPSSSDTLTIPRCCKMHKSNLPDAVVWNPYVEKATALADMPDDGWMHFICIEPARIIDPAQLQPAETWNANLRLISSDP